MLQIEQKNALLKSGDNSAINLTEQAQSSTSNLLLQPRNHSIDSSLRDKLKSGFTFTGAHRSDSAAVSTSFISMLSCFLWLLLVVGAEAS